MKKLYLYSFIVLMTSTYTSAVNAFDAFHSWNAPLNPAMATAKEMDAYKKDVIHYTESIDEEIAHLTALKKAAITDYNLAARAYNKETFFHQDKVPYYHPRSINHVCDNLLEDDQKPTQIIIQLPAHQDL